MAIGDALLFFTLLLLPLSVTLVMYILRARILAFPSVVFWLVFGLHSYNTSVSQTDVFYILWWLAVMMALMSVITAMYASRRIDDPLATIGEDVGEHEGENVYGGMTEDGELDGVEGMTGESGVRGSTGEGSSVGHTSHTRRYPRKKHPAWDWAGTKPSQRVAEIRTRAADRRAGKITKRTDWGEFK